MSNKPKKRFFSSHAKSSAMVVSLVLHAILIVVAIFFVAVTVATKEEQQFEAKPVKRPRMPPKKLQVPVKVNNKPKPKLRQRLVVKAVNRAVPEIKMPEMTGIKGGTVGMGGEGGMESIGFNLNLYLNLPELEFFEAKAKGEKVCFIVHFGPVTIGDNPYERMTGYTLRKRLGDMVNELPGYVLFNVACYWLGDTCAMSPKMISANAANKKMVMDWMAPANPLEGKYSHNFVWGGAGKRINNARGKWPTRVDKLPFYSIKWAYPYVVPVELTKKYLPGSKNGYVHWSRAVAWAILTQKPDTIFVLTTNYIDGWGRGNAGKPEKIVESYHEMFREIYGSDKMSRKSWPTINVVVLSRAGEDVKIAEGVLNRQFYPIWKGTRGDGSVIRDITDYMTDEEQDLMKKYRAEYRTE